MIPDSIENLEITTEAIKEAATGGRARLHVVSLRDKENRSLLPYLDALSPDVPFAIVSLRFNGKYDRDDIYAGIRVDYRYTIREFVGEWHPHYGVFQEHFLFVFGIKNNREVVEYSRFKNDLLDIQNNILCDDGIILADPSRCVLERYKNGRHECHAVKNISRKNIIERAIVRIRSERFSDLPPGFDHHFHITDYYTWGYSGLMHSYSSTGTIDFGTLKCVRDGEEYWIGTQ